MPLLNGEREEISSRYKNLIDFYFKKVKPIVTAAERLDSKQRMVITAAIEIRSSFDHVMRVDGILEGNVPETIAADSHLSLFDYCKKNLDKAHGHLYRAAYDAYDIIAFSLTDKIEKLLKKISQEALYTVIKDAAQKIVLPFDEALKIVTKAKVAKDVDGRDAEAVEFEMYERAAASLMDIRDAINANMPALIAYDKNLQKKKIRDAILTWVGWLVALVVSIYFGVKSLPH